MIFKVDFSISIEILTNVHFLLILGARKFDSAPGHIDLYPRATAATDIRYRRVARPFLYCLRYRVGCAHTVTAIPYIRPPEIHVMSARRRRIYRPLQCRQTSFYPEFIENFVRGGGAKTSKIPLDSQYTNLYITCLCTTATSGNEGFYDRVDGCPGGSRAARRGAKERDVFGHRFNVCTKHISHL